MEVGRRKADTDGLAFGRKRLSCRQQHADALALDIKAETRRAAEI
jgi:hypothetical protein